MQKGLDSVSTKSAELQLANAKLSEFEAVLVEN
jgi:hypothetical protein